MSEPVRCGQNDEFCRTPNNPREKLEDETIKSTALVLVENKLNFISENARLNALVRVDIVVALFNIRKKYPTKKEVDMVFFDLYNSGLYLPQIYKFVGTISIGTLHRWVTKPFTSRV